MDDAADMAPVEHSDQQSRKPTGLPPWRNGWERCYRIIFEAETLAGKAFDVLLLICIASSVIVVMLDSVASIGSAYGEQLRLAEWAFTILFTFEYFIRLRCVRDPTRYARSFFGIIDLIAWLPSYVALLIPGTHYLLDVRVLRMLRTFRVLKMVRHLSEARIILAALRSSREKITVFLVGVLTLNVIFGTLMYLIEGGREETGFTSIPRSVYWAIVTLTTVGYGDIAPVTVLGQAVAACVMILGYAIIAVPTGIVTVELNREWTRHRKRQSGAVAGSEPGTAVSIAGDGCGQCGCGDHQADARYCHQCGAALEP